jgi:hypothetical protein
MAEWRQPQARRGKHGGAGGCHGSGKAGWCHWETQKGDEAAWCHDHALTGRAKQVAKAPFFALSGPRTAKKTKAATVRPREGPAGEPGDDGEDRSSARAAVAAPDGVWAGLMILGLGDFGD